MKPTKSILEQSFRYVPSIATSVEETWRRFGWRPASEARERPGPRAAGARPRDTAVRPATSHQEI